jgi:hypothetical protein
MMPGYIAALHERPAGCAVRSTLLNPLGPWDLDPAVDEHALLVLEKKRDSQRRARERQDLARRLGWSA